jgi:hypothetical protein
MRGAAIAKRDAAANDRLAVDVAHARPSRLGRTRRHRSIVGRLPPRPRAGRRRRPSGRGSCRGEGLPRYGVCIELQYRRCLAVVRRSTSSPDRTSGLRPIEVRGPKENREPSDTAEGPKEASDAAEDGSTPVLPGLRFSRGRRSQGEPRTRSIRSTCRPISRRCRASRAKSTYTSGCCWTMGYSTSDHWQPDPLL